MKKVPVYCYFTKLVLNKYDLFTRIGLFDELADQSCFPGSEQTRENVYFRHDFIS